MSTNIQLIAGSPTQFSFSFRWFHMLQSYGGFCEALPGFLQRHLSALCASGFSSSLPFCCCYQILHTSSVQFSRSVVSDSASPWTAAHQALSITNSRNLLKLMSIESVMPSNHLILCRPLLLLPSIFPSTGVFSNETALCIRWPNYWSFSFSISPSSEHPGLISFRMDGLYLLDDLMFLVPFTVGFYSSGPGLTPQMTSGPRSTHLTCGYSQLKPFRSSDTLYLFPVAGVTNYRSFRNFKVSL